MLGFKGNLSKANKRDQQLLAVLPSAQRGTHQWDPAELKPSTALSCDNLSVVASRADVAARV